MREIIWRYKLLQYGQVLAGYLGKWHCFSISWDVIKPKDDPRKYKLTCMLPGIRTIIDNFLNEEDAKEHAETVKNIWIEGLNNPLT